MANLEAMKGEPHPDAGEGAPDRNAWEFDEPDVSINKTDITRMIAQHLGTLTETRVTTTGRHVETGQTCTVRWELDQWKTEPTEASKEILAYQQAVAEKLGFSADRNTMIGDRVQEALSGYEGLDQLFEEMTRTDEVSLSNSLRLKLGGDCMAGSGAGAGDRGLGPGLGPGRGRRGGQGRGQEDLRQVQGRLQPQQEEKERAATGPRASPRCNRPRPRTSPAIC